jgi:hypothetical protein
VEEHQHRPASHAFIGDVKSVDLDHVHDTRRDGVDQASFAQTPVNREDQAAAWTQQQRRGPNRAALSSRAKGSCLQVRLMAPALDDEQERRSRRLLLGVAVA